MILDLLLSRSADPKLCSALQLSRRDLTDELSLFSCRQTELPIGRLSQRFRGILRCYVRVDANSLLWDRSRCSTAILAVGPAGVSPAGWQPCSARQDAWSPHRLASLCHAKTLRARAAFLQSH